MSYDPDLYTAELHCSLILIRYHLRQIRAQKDATTGKRFTDALAVLADEARKVYRDMDKDQGLKA